jgi:hypothetical protein
MITKCDPAKQTPIACSRLDKPIQAVELQCLRNHYEAVPPGLSRQRLRSKCEKPQGVTSLPHQARLH